MKRIDRVNLSSIIGDIYDCAINPSAWSSTLSRITLMLNAAYTTIALADLSGRAHRMAAQSPWDPEQLRILNENYGVEGIPGLKAMMGDDLDKPWSTLTQMPEDAFQLTPFYQNWAQPQGLRDACIVKFVHTPDRIGLMACVTRANRDIIGPVEQEFLALISPHLRRAALIGDLLDQARIEAQYYQATLHALSIAVVLTSADGRVLFANEAAETMFRNNGPVLKSNGKLKAEHPAAQSVLQHALAMASETDQSLGAGGIGIPVSGKGQQSAVAYVLPLTDGTARGAFRPATAAVFVSAPTAASPPPHAILAALYNLTPAEARVAVTAMAGMTKPDMLHHHQISENTLKTQLSQIYKKTGTTNIGTLIKLASSISVPTRLV